MEAQRIDCPRRHCPDKKLGWRVVCELGNGLREYECASCRKLFYYNARSQKLYSWHEKYSSLKYFPFASDVGKISDYETMYQGQHPKRFVVVRESDPQNCDFILVLGGDGTMLQAVNSFARYKKPFLGVNFGHRGFLVNDPGDFSFERVINEDYGIFKAALLEVAIKTTDGSSFTDFALNDITIHEDTGQSAWLTVAINGEPLGDIIRGDGLIVCTPLGSTAYTTNAGGVPVLATLPVFELTPIAVEPKNRLPIVVPDSSIINIKALELPKRNVRATQGSIFNYRDVAEIEVRKAALEVELVFFKPNNMPWDTFFLRRFSEKIFKS